MREWPLTIRKYLCNRYHILLKEVSVWSPAITNSNLGKHEQRNMAIKQYLTY